jgi:hypothetical protein
MKGTVVFTDGEEVEVDFVAFATGYRQQASFVAPEISNLAFDRVGNDVPLYKYVFPVTKYGTSFGYINLGQTVTFMAADLQCRAFFRVFKGAVNLPPSETMMDEVKKVRITLTAQMIDRSQLRVQAGAIYLYYEDLAEFIGAVRFVCCCVFF